ncbi:hypothetical protein J6590_073455 [Homalodisca vitripennis]|nr:hypothetical protein J6590_073455 [Homalodisca vitripennis]
MSSASYIQSEGWRDPWNTIQAFAIEALALLICSVTINPSHGTPSDLTLTNPGFLYQRPVKLFRQKASAELSKAVPRTKELWTALYPAYRNQMLQRPSV